MSSSFHYMHAYIGQHRSGTSGKLMAGCEMKIDKPDEYVPVIFIYAFASFLL